MTTKIQPPMVAASLLDATIVPSAMFSPALQWFNLIDDSKNAYLPSIANFEEQKPRIKTDLRPIRQHKPQKETYQRPCKSTAYISREDLSPERMKHLDRNRIAANKCRMKRKQKHKELQDTFDAVATKRKDLLEEISALKEDVWQLKNQILQHAAKCDDQDVYQQLARMTQECNHAIIHSPSPSISVDTMSDGSIENEGSKPYSSAKSSSIPSSESPENLFDIFIDIPPMEKID